MIRYKNVYPTFRMIVLKFQYVSTLTGRPRLIADIEPLAQGIIDILIPGNMGERIDFLRIGVRHLATEV